MSEKSKTNYQELQEEHLGRTTWIGIAPWEMSCAEFCQPRLGASEWLTEILDGAKYPGIRDYTGLPQAMADALDRFENECEAHRSLITQAAVLIRRECTTIFPDKATQFEYSHIEWNENSYYTLLRAAMRDGHTVPRHLLLNYPDLLELHDTGRSLTRTTFPIGSNQRNDFEAYPSKAAFAIAQIDDQIADLRQELSRSKKMPGTKAAGYLAAIKRCKAAQTSHIKELLWVKAFLERCQEEDRAD
jgi:hypothetical protein